MEGEGDEGEGDDDAPGDATLAPGGAQAVTDTGAAGSAHGPGSVMRTRGPVSQRIAEFDSRPGTKLLPGGLPPVPEDDEKWGDWGGRRESILVRPLARPPRGRAG